MFDQPSTIQRKSERGANSSLLQLMLTNHLSLSNSAGAAASDHCRVPQDNEGIPEGSLLLPRDAANTCKRQLETGSSNARHRSILTVWFLIKLVASGKTSPDCFVLLDKTA